MKKLLLILFTIGFCGSLLAQKKNVIKANLFSPIVRTGSFFYERGLSDATSAQLGVFYSGASVQETKFRGFGITPEFRFYPGKESPEKFYIAPYLRYTNFSLTGEVSDGSNVDEAKATLSAFGGGLLVGGQFIFGDVVALDMFIGPGYAASSLDVEAGDEGTFNIGAFDGFTLRVGVCVGVAF
ncbi:MAG: DUF3575 domain-containing protein [Bacteroidetes bacterium]|nr:DUF3575 domain-containing protein [Bacteroidota bacterium]